MRFLKNRFSIVALATFMSANLMSVGCQSFDSEAMINAGTEIATQALSGSLQGENSLAVRDMLNLSGDRASTYLSNQGSWNNVLPENMQSYLPVLKAMDTNNYIGSVESSMKSAASQAAQEAGPVFKDTVRNMTITDALGILKGGDTSATQFFKTKTESPLMDRFLPIIKSNLSKTSFYESYNKLQSSYNSIPGTSDKPLDLESSLAEKVLNGMYEEMGAQEKLIRQDPVGRGSDLINRALTAARGS